MVAQPCDGLKGYDTFMGQNAGYVGKEDGVAAADAGGGHKPIPYPPAYGPGVAAQEARQLRNVENEVRSPVMHGSDQGAGDFGMDGEECLGRLWRRGRGGLPDALLSLRSCSGPVMVTLTEEGAHDGLIPDAVR
jgi:hypothetical protein